MLLIKAKVACCEIYITNKILQTSQWFELLDSSVVSFETVKSTMCLSFESLDNDDKELDEDRDDKEELDVSSKI